MKLGVDLLPRLPESYRLVLIAATNSENGIGYNGRMNWHLSKELSQFKRITNGHSIVMGRKTAESLPGPLHNRKNFVLSRSNTFSIDGFINISRNEVIEMAQRETVFVIGGQEVYEAFINFATGMILSRVRSDVPGAKDKCDRHFPIFESAVWQSEMIIDHRNSGFYTTSYQRVCGNAFFDYKELSFITPFTSKNKESNVL